MKAHIKIDKEILGCIACPFYVEIMKPGASIFSLCLKVERVITEDTIPSWCPFLVKEEKEEDDE